MSCPFTLNQLFEYGYKDICNCFFNLCTNDKDIIILEDILYKGEYNSFVFGSDIVNKDNPDLEIKRRISMAFLFLNNPDTFLMIADNNINLFHGTTSNALPNIIKYGLNSLYTSNKDGIEITTGEEWSRFGNMRDFVSFTDILDIAKGYSHCSNNEESYYEVIIGTTVDDVYDAGKVTVSSDVPEVGVSKKLPINNIRAIFVPSDKVKFVKKMVNNKIIVLPIDGFDFDFYHNFDRDIINYLNNYKVSVNSRKKFDLTDIKRVVMDTVSKLRDNIKNGDYREGDIYYDGRKIR